MPATAPVAASFLRRNYTWFLLAAVTLTLATAQGFRYQFSAFYVAILEEFHWDRASTAGIGSVNVFTYGALVVFSGMAVDRFGPRLLIPVGFFVYVVAMFWSGFLNELWQFYAVTGVLAGAGFAFSGFIPGMVVLSTWFVHRRGLAFGVAQSGNGLSFLIASAAQLLIATVGWRAAYVIVALGMGIPVLALILLFIRRRPQDLGLRPDGDSAEPARMPSSAPRRSLRVVNRAWAERRWTPREAMRTYQFWALFAANFLVWGVSFSLVTTHQAAYARDNGHSAGMVALMLSLYGVANLVGALCGFLSDRLGRELTYTIGGGIACLGLVALIFADDPSREWLLLTYGALFAFGLGLLAPSMSATHADLFQGPHFGAINGLIVTGFALGATISPWAAGYIYDTAHSYLPSFLFSIVAIVGACAAIWVARPSAVRSAGAGLTES